MGGFIARQSAVNGRQRGLKLHYPLLVASAYTGFVIWHRGYSGSAQLFLATPGHAMEAMMGVVPVTETLFQPYNVGAALRLLFTLPVLMAMLRPGEDADDIIELPEHVQAEALQEEVESCSGADLSPGERLERQCWINAANRTAIGRGSP